MRSVRELLQFNFDADEFARRAPKLISNPQENLEILGKIIKNHNEKATDMLNKEDCRQIYRLFITAHQKGTLHTEFDSPKRIRKLACCLTYSEDGLPRIVDMPQLRDALTLIEDHFRISVRIRALLCVFDALLQAWDAPNAGILQTFVKKHLIGYEGRWEFVKKSKSNIGWFCDENGAIKLARSLFRRQVKLSEVWSHLSLPDRMHDYRYFGIVAEAYVALNHHLDRESVGDIVEFVEMHRNDTTARSIASRLIEALGPEASEHVRQPVQSYAFGKWQDPRLPGGDGHWRSVSAEAKKIFKRWITKEDLRFFFDTVAKECNDPKFAYRKAFWLAYLEHISFCRPILGRRVHLLLRNNPEALEYYRERRPATLMGGASNQHAFIIQMRDCTFVEFSTAAACYVYDDARRPFSLHDPQYSMTELRSKGGKTYRQPHPGSERYLWQRNFALWLRSNLGIKRLRSYRL